MAVQEPYELQVAKGQIAGASTLYKFGTNPDVDGTEETVWSTGGDYPWPTAAFTAFVSSSSTADTSAGTGAQTVTVEGVDENYAAQTVTVNMNGQTQVQLGDASGWLRVNRIFVATSGSGGTAAGTIYVANTGVTSGVPTGITYGHVVQGENQSQMSVYTVPAGFTLYLDDVTFTAAIAIANKNVTAKFVTRDFGSNTFRTRFIQTLQSNLLILPLNYPLALAEKTDIECRAFSDTSNVEVGASFQGVLIAN
tara:strand:+ start:4020 stop:4775 length:756 start_codon:yes stop_codon:yes gene_type:complete